MKLLNIIDNKRDILSHLDTDRIYVENVRSFFNIPTPLAKFYCEMAVKQKFFSKRIGIICPNEECNRIVLSVDNYKKIPKIVECEHCMELERDKYEFSPQKKDLIEFYQLIKNDN